MILDRRGEEIKAGQIIIAAHHSDGGMRWLAEFVKNVFDVVNTAPMFDRETGSAHSFDAEYAGQCVCVLGTDEETAVYRVLALAGFKAYDRGARWLHVATRTWVVIEAPGAFRWRHPSGGFGHQTGVVRLLDLLHMAGLDIPSPREVH